MHLLVITSGTEAQKQLVTIKVEQQTALLVLGFLTILALFDQQ